MPKKKPPLNPSLQGLPDPGTKPSRKAPPNLGALADWEPPTPGKPGRVVVPEVPSVDELFGKGYVDAYSAARVRNLAAELASRRVEALALYEPLPIQKAFHASKARYRLARGSNRSGKTLIAAVEVARAATGQDPHAKYPLKDGVFFCVGKDQKHLGQVMYRKLFRSEAFKIIRDEDTGAWRAFRPWQDYARAQWAKPAPPLIPKRMVLEVAWENKKEHVPSVIRLVNGWELHFFSSLGKPPQGSPIDGFWLDEEIVDPTWYPEMAARIVDRKGRGIWSFTPQAGTDQAYELHERAEKERALFPSTSRSIEEFEILLADNRHLDEDAKRALAQDLTEEEARVRVGGEYAVTGYRVYPNFNMLLHGYPCGEVPPHWTRYAYVDPGHRVCACLFGAIPPPEEGDFILLYDEVYAKEATAESFAVAMFHACKDSVMQAFMMDYHMAIHTELGLGKTVLQQYSEALAKQKVASVSTGSSFLLANDDKDAGILAVQGLLRLRPDGTPKLRVMREKLPHFEWEIKRYHRKRVRGEITNEPDQRRDNHLMDNLRYLALHEPRYVLQKSQSVQVDQVLKAFRAKQQKKHQGQDSYVNLGPRGRFF